MHIINSLKIDPVIPCDPHVDLHELHVVDGIDKNGNPTSHCVKVAFTSTDEGLQVDDFSIENQLKSGIRLDAVSPDFVNNQFVGENEISKTLASLENELEKANNDNVE